MIFDRFRKSRARDFENVMRLLAGDGEKWRHSKNFRQICSAFKTGYVILDNMVYDNLGMSGDEVLAMLRDGRTRL